MAAMYEKKNASLCRYTSTVELQQRNHPGALSQERRDSVLVLVSRRASLAYPCR